MYSIINDKWDLKNDEKMLKKVYNNNSIWIFAKWLLKNGCHGIINIIRRYFLGNVAKFGGHTVVWIVFVVVVGFFFLYLLLRVFLKRYTKQKRPIVVQLHILKLTSRLIWVYLKASLFFRSTHKEGKFTSPIFFINAVIVHVFHLIILLPASLTRIYRNEKTRFFLCVRESKITVCSLPCF